MIEHMFDVRQDLDGMDADATLAYAVAADAALNTAEVAKLRAAAHWADLHAVVVAVGAGQPGAAGCERLIRLGGAGTPEVAEFATAELGAVLGISTHAADDWSRPRWTCGTGCPACGPGCRPGRSKPGSGARSPTPPDT